MLWETGAYKVNELMVLRPSQSPRAESGRRRFDVLAFAPGPLDYRPSLLAFEAPERTRDFAFFYPMILSRPFPEFDAEPHFSDRYVVSAGSADLPEDYWTDAMSNFSLKSGQITEWTIPLPEELIRAVREALKREPPQSLTSGNPPA
jgi:hypothetical protein